MKIYIPDQFTGTSFIEAPKPLPPPAGIVVDVRFAMDVLAVLGTRAAGTPRTDGKETFWAVKRFLDLVRWHSVGYARRRVKNKLYRMRLKRHLSFVSVAGIVESTGENITKIEKGDAVAALGFLQPALADYVVVPECLTVRISKPTQAVLRSSSLLFPGAAAAYAVSCVSELRNAYGNELAVATAGRSIWIDITVAILRRRLADVSVSAFEDEMPHPMDCLLRLEFAAASLLVLHDGRQSEGRTEEMRSLCMPEPWRRDNLNVYSSAPLGIPEWCERPYLEAYVSFTEEIGDEALSVKPACVHVHDLSESVKSDATTLTLYERQSDAGFTNLGVVGVGLFGSFWLHRLMRHKTVRVRSVADLDVYKAWLAARTYCCDRCSSDPNVVLDAPDLDAVLIATYHASHMPLAVRALRAGKFVYLEKPPVVSFEQLRDLMKAVKARPGFLFVGFNRRYAPMIRLAKQWLDRKTAPVNLSFICRLWDEPPNSFYYWPDQGTRIVSNLCHHLDLAYFLIGKKPVSVSAASSVGGKTDENLTVTVAFEDGSLATILFGDRGDSSVPGEEVIRIMCDTMTIDIHHYGRIRIRDKGVDLVRQGGKPDFGRVHSLRTFIDCVAGRRPVPTSPEDLYWSSLLFLSADRALRTGMLEAFPGNDPCEGTGRLLL